MADVIGRQQVEERVGDAGGHLGGAPLTGTGGSGIGTSFGATTPSAAPGASSVPTENGRPDARPRSSDPAGAGTGAGDVSSTASRPSTPRTCCVESV